MSDSSGKKIIAILKLILLVAVIAGIPAFLYLRYGSGIFSKDTAYNVLEYLRQNSRIAFLLIIGIQVIQVVVCVLPGQPIQFAASYMFGVGRGYLLSVIGAVIGTTISFYLAKSLGSEAMHLFFDEEKIRDYQRRLNSGRGTIGRSPAMLGSLLAGHFFGKENYTAIIILTVVIALIMLICFVKRDKLIDFLDMIEKKDAESEVKTDD